MQKLLSLLLSFTLVFTSITPALAQVRSTADKTTPKKVPQMRAPVSPDYFHPIAPTIVQDNIDDTSLRIKRSMFESQMAAYMGSLTEEQQIRILEIKNAFTGEDSDVSEQNEFEQFQQLYRKDIDNAVEEGMNKLEKERRTVQKELDKKAEQARLDLAQEAQHAVPSQYTKLHSAIKNDFLKHAKASFMDRINALSTQYPAQSAERNFLEQLREREQAILDWQLQHKTQLEQWYEEGVSSLNQWKTQQLQREKKAFEKNTQESLKQREEFVKQAVADLWRFRTGSSFAYEVLLLVAPTVLLMRTSQGESFFSKEQKVWLANQYNTILTKCLNNEQAHEWAHILSAISGTSVLFASKDIEKSVKDADYWGNELAKKIRLLLVKNYQNERSVSLLLTGMAALLGLQKYREVKSVLEYASRAENDFSDVDFFSFETLVNAIANKDGKYLGNVSKHGEYSLAKEPNKNAAMANVWEDVALLLAQEGSDESLSLLREYGVEKCRVSDELQAAGKRNYVLRCGGIKPFVVGALWSGKSGADKYHLSGFTRAGEQVMMDAKIHIVTEQEAARTAQNLRRFEENYYAYAASMNLTPAAMIARGLFLEVMGDINPETELRLDKALYEKAWLPNIKNKRPLDKYNISSYDRNSAPFHNKQIRYERADTFRTVARVADVAVLVWCVVDISKWLLKGEKMAYALFKMSRMARQGISATERLAILRKLNIPRAKFYKVTHIPQTITTRLKAPVLAVAPQFGLKPIKFNPSQVNVGEVLAQGLQFSRQTGEVSLVGVQGLREQGVSPLSIQQTKNALQTASADATATFGKMDVSLGKNHTYKQVFADSFSKSLLAQGLDKADIGPLVAKTRSLSIKAPKNLKSEVDLLAGSISLDSQMGGITLAGLDALREQGVSDVQVARLQNLLRATEAESLLLWQAKLDKAPTLFGKKFFWRKDHKYKKLFLDGLSELSKKEGWQKADIELLVKKAKSLSIKVPQAGKELPAAQGLLKEKKSVWPLMVVTGLSLSSASSGLIVPLENTYGDQITETDKMWITIGLPYVPSLFSAFIAPFVKKWGALNVLKTSLLVSSAGLATAGVAGFHGVVDKENLPPLWPLFVSGAAIGVSAALSRASLNILIDSIGGGGKLVQSMLFKNLGSSLLLLPPIVGNLFNPNIDFSLAFPVLGALSLGALGWVSRIGYEANIGRVPGFMKLKPFEAGKPLSWGKTFAQNTGIATANIAKDGWSSFRLLGTKEILPIVLATTAFTGFEAATLNKTGNQLAKRTVGEWGAVDALGESNHKNVTAWTTTTLLMLPPILMRAFAPRMFKTLNSPLDATAQYRRMLTGSLALNIAGGSLLYANGLQGENAPWGWVGLGLLGLGTANVTQSFQKLADARVVASSAFAKKTKGITDSAILKASKDELVTKMKTAFSTSQLGLAAVPLIVGKYQDRHVEAGTFVRDDGPQTAMWIPLTSIGLSFALAAPSLKLAPHIYKLPTGLVGGSKLVFGSYPAAFKQMTSFGQGILQSWGLLSTPQAQYPQGFNPAPAPERAPEVEDFETSQHNQQTDVTLQ